MWDKSVLVHFMSHCQSKGKKDSPAIMIWVFMCKSPIYLRDGIYSYTNNSIIRNLEISLLFHIMSSIYSIVTPVKRKRSHDYDPRGKKSKIIPYKVPKGFDIYNYLQIWQIRNTLKFL